MKNRFVMKSKLVFIFLVFYNLSVSAQQTFQGKITYIISQDNIKLQKYYNSTKYKKFLKSRGLKIGSSERKTLNNAHDIKATLVFNKKESLYDVSPSMNIEKNKSNSVYSEAGAESKFYYNSDINTIFEQNCKLLGDCFLIEQPLLD